jgi:hypothetical protein
MLNYTLLKNNLTMKKSKGILSKRFKSYQLAVFNRKKKLKEIQGLQTKVSVLECELSKEVRKIIAPTEKIGFDLQLLKSKFANDYDNLTTNIIRKGGLYAK